VAAIGVVINTLTALLFVRGHHDANIRGAFLHMAADAAISLGVVVAGIGIVFTGPPWIDPVVSIVITLVIVVGTWGLFTESVDLALDAVPRGIDIDAVEAALAAVPGVAGVRDLRVWGASTSEASLTAHLVVPHGGDAHATLAAAAEAVLRQRFRITHTTGLRALGQGEAARAYYEDCPKIRQHLAEPERAEIGTVQRFTPPQTRWPFPVGGRSFAALRMTCARVRGTRDTHGCHGS